MKSDRSISQIIEKYTPAISSGQESVDSILEKFPQLADELRPQLEAVQWLINARSGVEPRVGFITSSRTYIESEIKTTQPHHLWQRVLRRYTPQRWVFNFAAPVVLILLLVLIINSFMLTARLSLPGDPLYSAKIVLEDIRVALIIDPVKKTDMYMELSRERTTEFVDLVLEGDYKALPAAATRLENEIIASLRSINDLNAKDLEKVQPETLELRETLSNENFMLNILLSSAPLPAHSGIEMAIQVTQEGLMALR